MKGRYIRESIYNMRKHLDRGISLLLIFGAICIWSLFFVHTIFSETGKALYLQFENSIPADQLAFLLWVFNCKLDYTKSLIIGSVSGILFFLAGALLYHFTKRGRIERKDSSVLLFATYVIIFLMFSASFDPHLMTNAVDPSLMVVFALMLALVNYLHIDKFGDRLSEESTKTNSKRLRVRYLEMKDSYYKELFRSSLAGAVAMFVSVVILRWYQISTGTSLLMTGSYDWSISTAAWGIWIFELLIATIALELEIIRRIDIVQKTMLSLF
jgi:uncharacterized membrane protein (UPF0136 family)